ncbi:MAG: hypothetical protein U1G05_16230 [Kiritimatiellia bacterium]
MATAIDLNPVRAGIDAGPRFPPMVRVWRGRGRSKTRAGRLDPSAEWPRLRQNLGGSRAAVSGLMFLRGGETGKRHGITRGGARSPGPRRRGVDDLGTAALPGSLLTDSVAFGNRAFLDRVFAGNRSLFSKRRTSGPRPMKGGAAWQGLMTLRALRLDPIA